MRMGDLTGEEAEVLVNPANQHLKHGGGLAAAIVRKGGHQLQEESDNWLAKHGPLKVGENAITGPGKMTNCKYVVHAVGPIWKDVSFEFPIY